MYVVKRDGRKELCKFDKITERANRLCTGFEDGTINIEALTQKVVLGLYSGVHVTEIDTLLSETAAYLSTEHPNYSLLAARVAVTNLHKMTDTSFQKTMSRLHENNSKQKSQPDNQEKGIINDMFMNIVNQFSKSIEQEIVYERDFRYDFFGWKTLEKSYLLRINEQIVERPQHMLMRVAIGIHREDIQRVIETYNYMSSGYFTHATPTMFNAGTQNMQLSSCFLLKMPEDSLAAIYNTLEKCAHISKNAGGIGFSVSNIRASGSYIRGGSGGISNGIVPMLRVFDMTARYVDQGGGKRKGAFAVYLEPWHADIEAFLELKKNHGKEEVRARDLFYGLWIPDLFMKRVEKNEDWSLFCPNEAPGLPEVWGEEFEKLYIRYERESRARATVKAQALWFQILSAQIETGTPYMLYKDAANRKSNQQHLGTITCSNLCTEIIEYTSESEVAVCNLSSIALPSCISTDKDNKSMFDFKLLETITRIITRNLNNIIDINTYPVEEAKRSNNLHRPIGIGVQGLADAFIMLRMPFDSKDARTLNKHIFETIYYAAVSESCILAQKNGPYKTFEGSPMSRGVFQFDMWGVNITNERHDWDLLRQHVIQHGLRNSLLIAPMPTASTAQILGNNECIEPYTTNMFTRRVLSGEFLVINKHLQNDLQKMNIWNKKVREHIIENNGSVQQLADLPDDLKLLYRTVWELSMKALIDLASDRGPFICQSQSLNLFMSDPNYDKLSSMHFYAWKSGLKTGMYYLRTKAAADAVKFTTTPKAKTVETCTMCSA